MRLLLNEHLPIGLSAELHCHAVDTVSGRRWSGIKDGEPLSAMGGKLPFDPPRLVDRRMPVPEQAYLWYFVCTAQ
jgi:hypothetical protein